MNPNYEIIEQLYRLDINAGIVSQDQRLAQKELIELEKRSKVNEEIATKSRTEMNFNELEYRRIYKKIDELDERKVDRQNRLQQAKNDDEHRVLKRELDNLEKSIRETQRRADEVESRIESSKGRLTKAEEEIQGTVLASADERQKAKLAENKSEDQLKEIQSVRESYLNRLDERVAQHYSRVSKITRNPNGPICRVAEQACGNCRIGLAPQILNSILRGKTIEFCPTCSHILLPSES